MLHNNSGKEVTSPARKFRIFGAHGTASGTVEPSGVIVVLSASLVQPTQWENLGRRSRVIKLELSIHRS